MTEEDKARIEDLLVKKIAGAIVDTVIGLIAFGTMAWFTDAPTWACVAVGLIVFAVSGTPDRVREELTGEEAVRLWWKYRQELKRDKRAREQAKLMREVLHWIPDDDWVYAPDIATNIYGDAGKTPKLYPTLAGLERDGLVESRWEPGPGRDGKGRYGEDAPRRRQYRKVPA